MIFSKKEKSKKVTDSQGNPTSEVSVQDERSKNMKDISDKKRRKKIEPTKNPAKRVVVVSLINIVGIITILVLLGRLPTMASELKQVKNALLAAERTTEANVAELELQSHEEVINKLLGVIPDEAGLIGFVQEIEALKEQGSVKRFSFANQIPVYDKTGFLGIPVAIELEGNWEQIGNDLVKLQELPYLFRPISVNIRERDESYLINVMYGGFLYVDESLGKD